MGLRRGEGFFDRPHQRETSCLYLVFAGRCCEDDFTYFIKANDEEQNIYRKDLY